MPPDFDDYVSFQFRPNPGGRHGSYRSDTPESAPRVVVGERSSGVPAGRPARFYEGGRFQRAKEVAITKVGPGQYHAASQSRKGVVYVVNVVTLECECEDKWYGERVNNGKCKHLLAALLQERDPALFDALVDDKLREIQHRREAGIED